jgi:hypothetical protein
MIRSTSCHCLMVIFFIVLNLTACHRAQVLPSLMPNNKPVSLTKRDVNIVFVPENKRIPAVMNYQKIDHYTFHKSFTTSPFTMEIMVSPLMRNPIMTAKVLSKGKVVRQFAAKKTSTSMMSDKNTAWSPARSKLLLTIPFINENEEVVITTAYEWMDIRWIAPILFQDSGLIKEGSLTVDVPYGVTMHFKAAKDRHSLEFLPQSIAHESALWAQEDNRSGLGMRHIWKASDQNQSKNSLRADQLQVFLSFETPHQNGATMKFDNWQTVAGYINDRIERYDVPSNAIREYVNSETRELATEQEKVDRIVAHLHGVKKRLTAGSYQDQEVQPATRTFARNYGSPFDVAILGKAMLGSIGIDSDLLVASDKRYNPNISDFYTPSLFNSVLLAVTVSGKTIYFDPESGATNQLSSYLQGQQALLLRPKNTIIFMLPYDSADKNTQTYSYQLWMADDGALEGEYSVDVSGFFAEGVKGLSADHIKLAQASDIQHRIQSGEPGFSWANMELEQDPSIHGVRIVGDIKPQLLAKNGQGDYELKLGTITDPLIASLKNQKDFSSTAVVSLFLSLPEDYEVTNLPANASIQFDGINGRFYASYAEGKLTIEGTSMITMPIRKEVQENLKQKLLELSPWHEQAIIIHDIRSAQGVFEDAQAPNDQANP